jgi:SAM-dependent methyltransferase
VADGIEERPVEEGLEGGPAAGFGPAGTEETVRANRRWWDGEAEGYLAEHGDFLGPDRFIWCPEGLDEADARLLGDVEGRDVLEVGAGAGQCSRWLAGRKARVVALDQSTGMLRHIWDGGPLPGLGVVQADARVLPFAASSFDLACSAFGAVPFVADPWRVMAEVARVLRSGGRWVFAVTHPLRWALLDDPGRRGLRIVRSYFDRTPYVETSDGRLSYAEHHRTMGDRIRDLVAAGFVVEDLIEPEWPEDLRRVWDAWSPLRGRLVPGTAIFVARRP